MNKSNTKIWNIKSILLSVVFSVVPPVLYFIAEYKNGQLENLLVAAFYLSISMLFFMARRFSKKVALFAFMQWLFESFATFGHQYRLYFYSILAMCGAVVYFVKALGGS